MKDPFLPLGDGHTPLSPEDRRGLKPTYISTRSDLNDAEQRNIVKAVRGRRPEPDELLDDLHLRDLHRRMFGDVWAWAGEYRTVEVSIGIDPIGIPVAVRQLVDDVRAWIEESAYGLDELAVRFHHRLVAIHPFPNGNGRLGRIAADYLIEGLGGVPFTWGAKRDELSDQIRHAYVEALRDADRGDISVLLEFVRT